MLDFWTSFNFALLSGSTLRMLAMAEDSSTGDDLITWIELTDRQIVNLKSKVTMMLRFYKVNALVFFTLATGGFPSPL